MVKMAKKQSAETKENLFNIQQELLILFRDNNIDYFMCSFTKNGRTIEMSNCPEDESLFESSETGTQDCDGEIGENDVVGFARE